MYTLQLRKGAQAHTLFFQQNQKIGFVSDFLNTICSRHIFRSRNANFPKLPTSNDWWNGKSTVEHKSTWLASFSVSHSNVVKVIYPLGWLLAIARQNILGQFHCAQIAHIPTAKKRIWVERFHLRVFEDNTEEFKDARITKAIWQYSYECNALLNKINARHLT